MRYFLFCRHLYNRRLIFNIRIYFSCVPNCLPLYSWNTVISNIFLKLFHRDVHSVYLTCFLIKVVFWAAAHELDIRLPPCVASKKSRNRKHLPFSTVSTRTSRCLPQIVQNIRGVPIVFEMRVRIPPDEFYDENVLEYWTGR